MKLKIKLIYLIPCLLLCLLFFISQSKTVEVGNFKVEWELIRDEITHKEWEITVQNLDENNQDFNLSVFFNQTNFDLNQIENVWLYEWKDVEIDVNIYNNELIPRTCFNYTADDNVSVVNVSYDCSYYGRVFVETVQRMKAQWKPTKMNMVKQVVGEKEFSKSQSGVILIPKFGSKPKEDDYGTVVTSNGTKIFRLEFDVPLVRNLKGAGNKGLVAFIDDNTGFDYHPDWENVWTNYRNITVNNGSWTPNNYSVVVTLNSTVGSLGPLCGVRILNATNHSVVWGTTGNATLDGDESIAVVVDKFPVGATEQLTLYYNNKTELSCVNKTYDQAYWNLAYDDFTANSSAEWNEVDVAANRIQFANNRVDLVNYDKDEVFSLSKQIGEINNKQGLDTYQYYYTVELTGGDGADSWHSGITDINFARQQNFSGNKTICNFGARDPALWDVTSESKRVNLFTYSEIADAAVLYMEHNRSKSGATYRECVCGFTDAARTTADQNICACNTSVYTEVGTWIMPVLPLVATGGKAATAWIDTVGVRRFATAEPTTSLGAEQSAAAGNSPYWYNNASILQVNYTTTQSEFSVNWTTAGLTTIYIEGNWSGAAVNYSMSNDTETAFYWNETMPSGQWYWRSFCKDAANNENVTDKWEFYVGNGTNILDLTFENSTSTYHTQNITVTFNERINVTGSCEVACAVLSNETADFSGFNNTFVRYPAMTYKITLNSSGTANVTENTTTHYMRHNQADNVIEILFNNGTEYANQNMTVTFNQTTNVTINVTRGVGVLYRNHVDKSVIENGTVIALPANATGWNYSLAVTGNVNFSSNSSTHYLQVLKYPLSIDMWINSTKNADHTYQYKNRANITCVADKGNAEYELLRNGTPMLTTRGLDYTQRNYTAWLTPRIYNFTCEFNGTVNTNFTAASQIHELIITNGTNEVDLYIDNGTEYRNSNVTIMFGTLTNVTINITHSTGSLYRNHVDKSILENNTDIRLPVNTSGWNYTLITAGNYNYSANSTTFYLRVNKNTSISATLTVVPSGWVKDGDTPVNVSFTENNPGDMDCLYNVTRDKVAKNRADVWTATQGSYIYRVNSTACFNYTAREDMDYRTLIISPEDGPGGGGGSSGGGGSEPTATTVLRWVICDFPNNHTYDPELDRCVFVGESIEIKPWLPIANVLTIREELSGMSNQERVEAVKDFIIYNPAGIFIIGLIAVIFVAGAGRKVLGYRKNRSEKHTE